MRTLRIKCKKCGAGPFTSAQALGAHNRWHHHTTEESNAKERVRQKIVAGFKVADSEARLDQLSEENWHLRFLLRRGAKLDPGLDLMAAVRLEIVKMEQELINASADHGTPF